MGFYPTDPLRWGDASNTGTIIMSAANTYTGTTQLNAGKLQLDGSLASLTVNVESGAVLDDVNGGLAPNSALINAGTLVFGANDTVGSLVNTGTISGSATLAAATYALNGGSVVDANLGAGTLTSNGTVALNGTSSAAIVNIASGIMTLGSAERLLDTAAVSVNGTLQLGGNEAIDSLFGNGNVNLQIGTLTVNNGAFSGVIDGTNTSCGLAKISSGTLTLSGENTYIGTTAVNSGTLNLDASLASNIVTVASGATFNDNNGGLDSGVDLTVNGIFNLNANDAIDTLLGSGTVNLNGGTLTASQGSFSGAITGSNTAYGITKTGSDTLTLSGNNTYLGATQVNEGTATLTGSLDSQIINVVSGAIFNDINGGLASDATAQIDGTFNLYINDSINTLNGSGQVVLDNAYLSVNNGYFSGVASGNGGLIKLGAGTLTLSGANTYIGTTAVNSGTLNLDASLASNLVTVASGATFNDNNGGLDSGVALTVNGTVNLNNTNDEIDTLLGSGHVDLNSVCLSVNRGSFSGDASGSGSLTKLGSGTLILSGANTYLGPTALNTGTLTGSLLSDVITVASGATLNDNNGGLAPNAALINDGTLVLGANDAVYSLVNTGTISGSASLSAATYALNGGSVVDANLGAGTLTSNGTVALNGTSAAAIVNIASGTMTLGSAERLLDTAAVSVNGTLQLGGDEAIDSLFGNGNVNLQIGTLTVNHGAFSGVIAGTNTNYGLTKISSGTLTLSGENTYIGTTAVNSGTLNLDASLASKIVTVASGATFNDNNGGLSASAALTNNGTFYVGANDTVASLVNTGRISGSETLAAGIYDLNAGSVVDANLGAGTLTSNGNVRLNGTSAAETVNINTGVMILGSAERLLNTGAITVNGTLQLGGNEAIDSLSGNGNVNLQIGTLTVNDGDFSGVISGDNSNFGLTKIGSGTLTLSGTNTYLGTTEVSAGTLNLDGSLASQVINVSSAATLECLTGTLSANAALTNDGTINFGTNQTVASLVNNGMLNGGSTLTAATYAFNNGSIINANLGSGTLITSGSVVVNATSAAETVVVTPGSTLTLMLPQSLNTAADVTVDGTLVLGNGDEIIRLLNGTGHVNVNTFQLIITEGGNFSGRFNTENPKSEGASFSGRLNTETPKTDPNLIIQGGTFNIANGAAVTSRDVIVKNGATLVISDSSNLSYTALTGRGFINTQGNILLTSSNITVQNGATLVIPDSANVSYTTLTGHGFINTQGNTFTNLPGSTVSGFLTFSHNFQNNGTLSPGNSPGLSTFLANYIDNGILITELETTTPITGHSQVQVGGSITLLSPSKLVVQTYNNVLPTRGNVYQILADASGNPLRVYGTFSSLQFNPQGSVGTPVTNAAMLFDVATGQLVATGLNSNTSIFEDLGTSSNGRRVAAALFKQAQVAQNQIDTATLEGTLARQIIDTQVAPETNLAYYAPDYYGAIADYAFAGDRALVNEVQNRISAVMTVPDRPCKSKAIFTGMLNGNDNTADKADIKRHDVFVGGDLALTNNSSVGAAISTDWGKIKAPLGSGEVNGLGGICYLRSKIGRRLTTLGTLGYSAQWNTLQRPTLNGTVEGTNNTTSWTGSLGLQHRYFTHKKFSMAPRIALIYSHANVSRLNEEGAIDALSCSGYRANLLTGEFGFSVLWSTQLARRHCTLEFVSRLEKVIIDDKDLLDTYVVGNPSIAYAVEFAKRRSVTLNYGLNLGYTVYKNAQIFVEYAGSVKAQAINAGLRINF